MYFEINPVKQNDLEKRMLKFGLFERDIQESFVRSSGKGGQKANKSSSCVYIRHLPTGIEVKCQIDRHQSVNRFLARRILLEKIESLILGAKSEEQKKIEKIRRQKRKRSKRAKEKLLKLKHRQSSKKAMRAKVPINHEG